ncbi:hypothetical protein D3C72_1017690 [compost metagenome]
MQKPIVALWAVALLAGLGGPAIAAPQATPESDGNVLTVQPLTSRAAADSKLRLEMADSLRKLVTARRAGASAVVYTNRRGQVTGVKIRAAGLPDADRLGAGSARYVVWLVGQNGRRVLPIGELESRNGARVDFGFTAETALSGYERLIITAEPLGSAKSPTGQQQFSADLTRMILSRM